MRFSDAFGTYEVLEEISNQEALAKIRSGAVLVDVRSAAEVSGGMLAGAIHIPHVQIPTRLPELEQYRSSTILLYCRSGQRSQMGAEILRQSGFPLAVNIGSFQALEASGVATESTSDQSAGGSNSLELGLSKE